MRNPEKTVILSEELNFFKKVKAETDRVSQIVINQFELEMKNQEQERKKWEKICQDNNINFEYIYISRKRGNNGI